ncbi:MAG: DUF1599 domain-containing protein [Bacteroidetes bacterium]|nr:DUF1599 domain-containing protein [Bacteroidota bacterium]
MSKEQRTKAQFEQIKSICIDIFEKKMKDYGSAWRILRTSSLTDQIFIKAQRIRSLQDKGNQKIDEGITPEFIGIVNYSVMALIQLDLGIADQPDLNVEKAVKLYHKHFDSAKNLMLDKNHDYSEAWREMRISSLVDIILVKLLRVKQIEDNKGKTIISEGVDANYMDIINYAVFSLIKMELEGEKP